MEKMDDFWARFSRKVLSSIFARDEVKTPLALLFRIAWLIPVVIIAALYAPGDTGFRYRAMVLGVGVFVAMSVMALAFAFFRPKHLVYGESGHRAEYKIEQYGTEKRAITHRELVDMEGTKAPDKLALVAGEAHEGIVPSGEKDGNLA